MPRRPRDLHPRRDTGQRALKIRRPGPLRGLERFERDVIARALQSADQPPFDRLPITLDEVVRLCWPFGISVRIKRRFDVSSGSDTLHRRDTHEYRAGTTYTR